MAKFFISMVAVAGLLAGTTVRADEEDIPLDKIPTKVRDAVKAKFPAAVFVSASKEIEDGKVLYEVKITNNKQTIEVTAGEDGKIVEIETQISPGDLPKVVTDAVARKYGPVNYLKAEDIQKGDQKYFEVLIAHAGRKTEVQLDKDGKILKEEDKTFEDERGGYAPRRFILQRRPLFGGCCCGGFLSRCRR